MESFVGMMDIKFKGVTHKFPKIIENRYKLGENLDKGGFGTLYECSDMKELRMHAIKIVSNCSCGFL
jgi:hypothetical protein